MGMASSQARLLSLTARMHQIEYKAARLEAMKLQTANESKRVYEEYLNSLEMTKIEMQTITTNAETTYVQFSAKDIYEYIGPRKQYTLETMDGKTLIPEDIHSVYQNTDSLVDFLKTFGLAYDAQKTVHHYEVPAKPVVSPEYYNKLKEYEANHKTWKSEEPNIYDFPDTNESSIAQAFEEAGSSCYTSALNGYAGCYAHVLAHIIDYTRDTGFGSTSDHGCNTSFYKSSANNYTTSTGNKFKIDPKDITGAGMDDRGGRNDLTMSLISQFLNEGNTATVLSTDPSFDSVNLSNNFNKLASMYNTNGSTKTLKQWAKDLYYLCEHYADFGKVATDVTPTIVTFQEHLIGSLNGIDIDAYINAYNEWTDREPKKPDVADYTSYTDPIPAYDEILDVVIAQDKDKAQWYTNIWNLMNNSEIKNFNETEANYNGSFGHLDVAYEVEAADKTSTNYSTSSFDTPQNENYVVIPTDQLDNPTWLTNMVNEGFAMLQVYVRKDEKVYNTSVAVETDLREVPDEKLIKKAEAKYEADMKRIDMKDRKYDQDLAAIEEERNATKQEIETLKTVAKDNVERTFKLFS